MKQKTKNWILTFLAGFLATVLGIVLTFGIEGRVNAAKRSKTAHLLAVHIVEKMDRTCKSLHEYLAMYDAIDSAFMCLHYAMVADTLERVDEQVVETFLVNSLAEYVQADVDGGMDAYLSEILNTIGNVELIGHIDDFYISARQCVKVSQQVIDQKRVVTDLTYEKFYGSGYSVTNLDYVRFLFGLPAYKVFYSRMQAARYPLREGEAMMLAEIDACKKILHLE